jgi:hypothetical protein
MDATGSRRAAGSLSRLNASGQPTHEAALSVVWTKERFPIQRARVSSMKWFRKVFGRTDYSADQQKLATLHLVAGDPQGMMMLVGRNKIFQDVVYIRIPEAMASSFPDYEIAGQPAEVEVSGLYGHQEDLNEYIRKKN